MTIEEGLFAFLTADVDLTALVGSRIYPMVLPEEPAGDELPPDFVTYQRTGGTREGAAKGATPCNTASYDVGGWSATYLGAKRLALTLRDAFDRAQDRLGTVLVARVDAEHTRDDYNPVLRVFGAIVSLTVQYLEG